jgi:hypothetical protein
MKDIYLSPQLKSRAQDCLGPLDQVLFDQRYSSDTVCAKLSDPRLGPQKARDMEAYRRARGAWPYLIGTPLSVQITSSPRLLLSEVLPHELGELARDVVQSSTQRLPIPAACFEAAKAYLAMFNPQHVIRFHCDPATTTPERNQWLVLIGEANRALYKFLEEVVRIVAHHTLTMVDLSRFEWDGVPVSVNQRELRAIQVLFYLFPKQPIRNEEFCRLYNEDLQDVARDSHAHYKKLKEALPGICVVSEQGYREVKNVQREFRCDQATAEMELGELLEPKSKSGQTRERGGAADQSAG